MNVEVTYTCIVLEFSRGPSYVVTCIGVTQQSRGNWDCPGEKFMSEELASVSTCPTRKRGEAATRPPAGMPYLPGGISERSPPWPAQRPSSSSRQDPNIIVDAEIYFKNQSNPSNSDIVRTFYTDVKENGFGNLIVDFGSIKSNNITVDLLAPLKVTVQFLITDGFEYGLTETTSSAYKERYAQINGWIEPVLKKYYTNTSKGPSISFRNSDGWIQAKLEYEFDTTNIVPSGNITNTILASTRPFIYVKYTLEVNDIPAKFDVFPYSLRIINYEFTPQLSNRSSVQFKNFSERVANAIQTLFTNKNGFTEVYVPKLSKGSIICSTEVTFLPGTTTNSSVAEEIRNGYSAIEATGLQLIPVSQSAGSQDSFPPFAIIIIVFCSVALLVLLVVIALLWKTGIFSRARRSFSPNSHKYIDISSLVLPHTRI
ncbi:uncharacterized protein LOC121325304 [Polyodon spathula]|uniref:uncharacterized protein LOC121325304 n=1 Tax=Polyodon spathula TaxID=7913 RepID=UPI001B7DEE9D|nr:uncharacterized protein LOC121325304 [Polyodon spathula]